MSLEEYEVILSKQSGVCAICGGVCQSGKRLAVDHCHKTDKVRGLLCAKCNLGIGLFDDEPTRIQAAITYLNASP